MSSTQTLREQFLSVLDRKHHWAWPALAAGKVPVAQLQVHFQQEWEVYVRDFPILLARVLGQGPPVRVREMLAANIFEEQTGGLSGTAPHPELFLRMMVGCGFSRSEFESVQLLPAAARYRSFLDHRAGGTPWVVGAAVLALFVEGSVNERKELAASSQPPPSSEQIEVAIQQHPLVQFYAVPPSAMDLIRAHKRVEGGHRRDAWEMVLDHATADLQPLLLNAMNEALTLWLEYRDAVAAACKIDRDV